ncbi:MAG: superoxide dismutase [Candidatus Aenigmarchaeota archaeon]|nr:superoxide dismutase [Candidatus Aenigmarchaeota archaeon]
MEDKFYKLPVLHYEYGALEPHISKDQLKLHHTKHHQAYVDNANAILRKIDLARSEDQKLDMKHVCRDLSFNVGGHILHKLFWDNLAPPNHRAENPVGLIKTLIDLEFGGLERFRKEFTQAALSVEGSGWAVLAYCRATKRPVILQAEKHNVNLIAGFPILLVLDVWEHAYYLDYENERGKYVESFWNLVNWDEVAKRLDVVLEGQNAWQN